MNILILGATGPTGQQLVSQALEKGHFVEAIVRDPHKLLVRHERLTVKQIDIFNQTLLSREIAEQDAVLSALGTGRDMHSDFISRVMPVIVGAMNNANTRRLLFLSSVGVGDTKKFASFFSKMVFRLFLKSILDDKFKADQLLRASNLDYTLVYPTSLTNGKKTGKYKAGTDLKLPFYPRISRADVADFMLKEMVENKFIRQTAIITD